MGFYKRYSWVVSITTICMAIACYFIKSQNDVGRTENEVWAFYHRNWGNFETDGKWIGWNMKKPDYANTFFDPPNTIPSVHFPSLGLYSSNSIQTIKSHMKTINSAGIDAIITSIVDATDSESFKWLLKYGEQYGVKVGGIVERADQMSPTLLVSLLSSFVSSYGKHKSLLRRNGLPVVILEQSSGIPNLHNLLANISCFIVGTGDAIYNYESGIPGFTSSSLSAATYLRARGSLFVPSISPGFNQTGLSIQNACTAASREGGAFYDRQWIEALETGTSVILIDSFNSWSDGTAIEPVSNNFRFPMNTNIWGSTNESDFYIRKTRAWSDRFKHR